jgi:hypothetical protein
MREPEFTVYGAADGGDFYSKTNQKTREEFHAHSLFDLCT